MHLPQSRAIAKHLLVLEETGSTNADLLARASSGPEPDFSVLITANQTAGRGRLDRVWVSPAGRSLAISVLVRPVLASGDPLSIERFGWLPLIAGVAMTNAVQALVPGRVSLKWPNDVQIDGLKVSGLLAELVPAANGVVLGAGVNLSVSQDELPTPTSTSLVLAGAALAGDALSDALLSGYLSNLREGIDEFLLAGGESSGGTLERVSQLCSTIGQRVRVLLPGGDELVGVASGIAEDGRLLIRQMADGPVVSVAAGDVTHLRYE